MTLHPSLTILGDTTWAEVWQSWMQREMGIWDELFLERGYESLEDWREDDTLRRHGFEDLDLKHLQWKQAEFKDAESLAPQILCGPFNGWAKFYEGPRRCTAFSEIIESDLFLSSKKLQHYLQRDLASQTLNLIVLYHPGRDVYMLLEGHHSLGVLCLVLKNKRALPKNVMIDLGIVPEAKWDLFSEILDGRRKLLPWQEWVAL